MFLGVDVVDWFVFAILILIFLIALSYHWIDTQISQITKERGRYSLPSQAKSKFFHKIN
jgi:hypothetical protein